MFYFSRFHALLRAHRCCLSVSSWDLSSNFIAWGLRWWGFLTCVFPSDGLLFSRILARRSVDCANRSRRSGPKTFLRQVSQGLYASLGIQWSCETHPLVVHFFTIATAFLSSFSLPLGVLALFFLFIWLLSTLWCGNRHLSPAFQPDSVL